MHADGDRAEDLIASISDGRQIDWDEALHGMGPDQKQKVLALRELSGIAEFSRSLQPAAADQSLPERWGEILLLERMGSGATAEVYRAWDPALQREVALKLLRPGLDSASLLEEGRAAGKIRHPNVVTVHGIDDRDGRIGLSMDLIRGIDLQSEVSLRGALSADEAAEVGTQISGALAAVHAAGLLHRDVKPANVVRDADGRYVLADFGLGMHGWEASQRTAGASGTPMYMAPELLAGGAPSERSDLYSLGLLLWFALAGRHPFDLESIEDLIRAAARGPRPTLMALRPELPAEIVRIVDRAIAPEPRERFAGAREITDALSAWRASGRATRHPVVRPAAIAVVAALLVIAAFVFVRTRPSPQPSAPVSSAPGATAVGAYDVEATLLRQNAETSARLASGDRIRPGDRLSLEFRASRPAWVYVLNEDERGECYLLFPQPSFDQQNPLAADTTLLLPGAVAGLQQGWTVTSAGGREHFLIVASPEPVPSVEAELASMPGPEPGRPIRYPSVDPGTLERLRGVGGVGDLPETRSAPAKTGQALDRFLALAGRETGVQGVWARKIILENPTR